MKGLSPTGGAPQDEQGKGEDAHSYGMTLGKLPSRVTREEGCRTSTEVKGRGGMPVPDALPLFPLGLVLFPGEPVPLHIFEPRYREMVKVCLDEDGPFGIVYAHEEGLATIGCTARIHRVVQRYEDGRLDIVAVGEDRFQLEGVNRDLSYLTAEVTWIDEPEPDVSDEAVRQTVITRHMKLLELAGGTPRPEIYDASHAISFIVGRNAGLDLADKQEVLEMTREEERLHYLSKHLKTLLVRVQKAHKIRNLAQGDGHADGLPEI
ncbi:MAG: LON peptidase substrate-binding domain-containing protein [Bacteroidota bacterium]